MKVLKRGALVIVEAQGKGKGDIWEKNSMQPKQWRACLPSLGRKVTKLRHYFPGWSQSQQSEQNSTCALCCVTELHLFRNTNFLRSPGRVGVELFSYP